MRGRFTRPFSTLVLLGASLLLCAAADAQIRYVASTGSNAGPCTHAAAPCRTLQRAIDTAPAGGEVRVLDSGNFGSPKIGKSLTVSGDGVTLFGRITIDAPGATVTLRGLQLNGRGVATDLGVYLIAAAAVHIERCSVERFSEHGIYAAAADTELFVTDSIARDNRLSGLVVVTGASVALTVDGSHFDNNGGDGIGIFGGSATITRSSVSGNTANGIEIAEATVNISSTTATDSPAGAGYLAAHNAEVTLEGTLSRGNFDGLSVLGSVATVSNSVIVGNSSDGIQNVSGTIRTRGNNVVVGNGLDVDGSLTPLPGT